MTSDQNHMQATIALHTAARRYCQDRFSHWAHVYEGVQAREKQSTAEMFEPGWEYSDEAYQTFPRYRIAKNIEVEVERLVPSSSTNFDELRTHLIHACSAAEAQLWWELKNPIARNALRQEAEEYKLYLRVLTPSDVACVEALPYRRVISAEEISGLWSGLKKIWGIDGSYWFPLKKGPVPGHLVAFHTDYFQEICGASILREALRNHGVTKVFQLHESGDPAYEIELAIFEPRYWNGGEQFSACAQFDWVTYASHESSITICGDWLIQIFRERCPHCMEHTYGGPYSTPDLRGTWKTG